MASIDADYIQANAWVREVETRLDALYDRLRAVPEVPTNLLVDVQYDIETLKSLTAGIFGLAVRARRDLNRESEKYHALREEWEDKHRV